MIGGFEHASTGRVEIAGQDVTQAPPYRRPVNTVFQDYALFPHMSVAENIAYGLSVKSNNVPASERKKRVEEALSLVGLEGMADRRPGALSGGQRQRVAMARAVVRRPRVLLLDEPLSALDVKLREGMQVELKRLHRELGITFLMVTHDQTEALGLSDRIVVMNQGRIAQIGTPTELYDHPATPYVADFIGATNLFDAVYAGREGDLAVFQLGNGSLLRSRRPFVAGVVSGRPVKLGIRPERFQTAAFEGANTLNCTILESLFHGDRLRMELTVDGIERPVFTELSRVAVPVTDAIAPGASLALHVDPVDVFAFAEGDTR